MNIPKDYKYKWQSVKIPTEKGEITTCINVIPNLEIVVHCEDCKKSHIDGKTTHYLWCTEWGRSTDTFGYCERGEREGE